MADFDWRRVDELYEAALACSEKDRSEFLDRACGGDSRLRAEVDKMLAMDARLGSSFMETGDSTGNSSQPSSSSSGAIEEGRFVPGDLIDARYRVVGLINRGGMGEVYRADDMKLRQRVALKFLPERLSANAAMLARFYQEVSVARQISHRHVCRVYDVQESQGQHFFTMEYIAGEDLSSLLKRIGLPPYDKAVEIARQLCAGLSAIHERGVLHRDLKPGNVMLDETGRVRITDFGLATMSPEIRGREAKAGTPAYMSPEQRAGGTLTVRSDIYALGLVLYELFLGKRPPMPDERVPDIGKLPPTIQRVIEGCLEENPDKRWASALQVAAALPGGDPLAEALKSGETPAPEMVAAAPRQGTMRPAGVLALVAAIVGGFGLAIFLSRDADFPRLIPLPKSPEVLGDRAREIAHRLGYSGTPRDSASGFRADYGYLSWLNTHDSTPNHWDRLATARPSALLFWYRQSPGYFGPVDGAEVNMFNPPNNESGMILTWLGTDGNLSYFEAVPPQVDTPSAGDTTPDWNAAFREAGLDMTQFRKAPSKWAPPAAYDKREAWMGSFPELPNVAVRVEMAGYRGRVVYFNIVPPWQRPTRQPRPVTSSAAKWFPIMGLFLAAFGFGAMLAVRNLRQGRGDRRGASRLAVAVLMVEFLFWVFQAHHVPTAGELGSMVFTGLRTAVFWAVFAAAVYLALEPVLRRKWPERLIGWTRFIYGNFGDPLVGRDVLAGMAAGVSLILIQQVAFLAPRWLGYPPGFPAIWVGIPYLGLSNFPGMVMDQIVSSLLEAVLVFFISLVIITLVRREWLGRLLSALAFWGVLASWGSYKGLSYTVGAFFLGCCIAFVIARFGLLSTVIMFAVLHVQICFPITSDFTSWYGQAFLLDLLLVLGLMAWAAKAVLSGQRLLSARFMED